MLMQSISEPPPALELQGRTNLPLDFVQQGKGQLRTVHLGGLLYVVTLDFLHSPFANLFWKCELCVGVGLGGHDVRRKCVRSDFRVHECKTVSSDHKFTQLRALLYVVTLVGICGDHIILPAQSLCKLIM